MAEAAGVRAAQCGAGRARRRLLAQSAQRQRLPRLQRLTLQHCGVSALADKQLAQAEWGLENLDLTVNSLSAHKDDEAIFDDNSVGSQQQADAECASAVGELATSLGLALQRLVLADTPGLSAAAVAALARHQGQRHLAGLRQLDISWNTQVGSDGIFALANAGRAPEHLRIGAGGFLSQAAAAIAVMPNLKRLSLFAHALLSLAPMAVVQWSHLETLERFCGSAFPLLSSSLRASSFPEAFQALERCLCPPAARVPARAGIGWLARCRGAPRARAARAPRVHRPAALCGRRVADAVAAALCGALWRCCGRACRGSSVAGCSLASWRARLAMGK